MLRYVLLLSVILFVTVAGLAAESGDVVTRTRDGKLQIKSTVIGYNGCAYAGQATVGAPVSHVEVENAVLVTVPVKSAAKAWYFMHASTRIIDLCRLPFRYPRRTSLRS